MPDEPGGSALELFYSCAPQDEPLRKALEKQLKPLERQHLITGWHRGLIPPGVNHQQEAEQHLQSASLILLLLNPNYITSDECYAEMERALDRYNAGQTKLVPILLRPVEFDLLPVSSLLSLPSGGKAVTAWSSRELALNDIAIGGFAACWRTNEPSRRWPRRPTRARACGTSPMDATCCSRDGKTCSTSCMTA